MTATDTQETTVGLGIRLTLQQRQELEKIAKRQCNTVGGIIRLAVQNMVEQERDAIAALTLTQRRRQNAN